MTRKTRTRWLLAGAAPLATAVCFALADGPAPKGKYVVELPTKTAVASSTPAAADNPTVETGLVKWHKSLDDAQAAAKKSHKPVLLFQMMGYLDKKFC